MSKCKRKHVAKSDWFLVLTLGTVRVSKAIQVSANRQERCIYPAGGGSACCVEFRIQIRITGEVTSARSALAVSNAIDLLRVSHL